MTFRSRHFPILLATLGLLAGCAGSSTGGNDALSSISRPPPAAPSPRVPESYIIQRAPLPAAIPEPLVGVAEPIEPESVDLFEIAEAENARREAEARRAALDELLARIEAVRAENLRQGGNAARARYQGGFAPFEAVEAVEPATISEDVPDEPDSAEIAAARAAAEEAEIAAIAAEAEARRALTRRAAEAEARRVEAEAEARRAETEARRAEAEAVQPNARQDRANPPQQRRPILGRFATRAPTDTAETRTAEATPAPTRQSAPPPAEAPAQPVRIAALTTPPPAPRPTVERAPIPGLKPYILARTPSPTAKPRRAKPQRAFDVQTAAVLPGSTAAAVIPPDVVIPREPDADLGARFFPTPGKPSTLGTDQDSALDLASIDASPYGIGSALSKAVDGDTATAEWNDAVRLIENGEVEALAILEDADLELTLCSGRSILTTPPDLSAAATLTAPQIICGQNKPLALR